MDKDDLELFASICEKKAGEAREMAKSETMSYGRRRQFVRVAGHLAETAMVLYIAAGMEPAPPVKKPLPMSLRPTRRPKP